MPKRSLLVAVTLILALGGVVLWLFSREQEHPSPSDATASPAQVEPAPDQPAPPVDQPDLDRLARTEEMRGLHFSLRSAFEGGAPLERSRERLEPALRRLWPGEALRWRAACRQRVCQVLVEAGGPPDTWGTALQRDPGVRAVSDLIAWDPDGRDPAAYLMLSEEGAVDGAPILAEVERKLRTSPAVLGCLRQATEAGTLEYELEVKSSGITFRRGGTLGPPVRPCVDEQLAAIVTAAELPPSVKSQSLRVVLRSPR